MAHVCSPCCAGHCGCTPDFCIFCHYIFLIIYRLERDMINHASTAKYRKSTQTKQHFMLTWPVTRFFLSPCDSVIESFKITIKFMQPNREVKQMRGSHTPRADLPTYHTTLTVHLSFYQVWALCTHETCMIGKASSAEIKGWYVRQYHAKEHKSQFFFYKIARESGVMTPLLSGVTKSRLEFRCYTWFILHKSWLLIAKQSFNIQQSYYQLVQVVLGF